MKRLEGRGALCLCVSLLCVTHVCFALTLVATNAHAIVEKEVLVGELAHHAGSFVERLRREETTGDLSVRLENKTEERCFAFFLAVIFANDLTSE